MTGFIETAAERLRSPRWQAAAVVLAFGVVAWTHRHGDGLWFQGDAPRHAINGLFWWDLLTTRAVNPVDFALRYYARYPVIAPVTYPPFFYILEGIGFATFGPSPYVARAIVVAFAAVAGLYTTAWTRRWIGTWAGWAGAFVAFAPAMVVWSNTVMLNVPATALAVASLYHFRRWIEGGGMTALVVTTAFVSAALFTYYPNAAIVMLLAAWAWARRDKVPLKRRVVPIVIIGLIAGIPLGVALLVAPVHTARQLPTWLLLADATTWTYYWRVLPTIAGAPIVVMGVAGAVAGLASVRWRGEAIWVVLWIVVLIVTFSVVQARDPRYVLAVIPALVIAASIGVACISTAASFGPMWQTAALVIALVACAWRAATVHVPEVSGFREVVAYLDQQASTDAVLYDGEYDGVFGFYFRASDRDFRRRFVRADKALYYYGPGSTFDWQQTSNVTSTDDVVDWLRRRIGCRWIAIEVPRPTESVLGRRLLRDALHRPEFERVKTFPIFGAGERRIELYRLKVSVQPATDVDLVFPALTDRHFTHIVPIAR